MPSNADTDYDYDMKSGMIGTAIPVMDDSNRLASISQGSEGDDVVEDVIRDMVDLGILDHSDVSASALATMAISGGSTSSSSKRIRYGIQRLCEEVCSNIISCYHGIMRSYHHMICYAVDQ